MRQSMERWKRITSRLASPFLQNATLRKFRSSNTPAVQHPNTPLLHYSHPPPLHFSTTPILHYSILPLFLASLFSGWFLTPDQQGQRYFRHGEYVQAAQAFHDPMWQGIAWYRAGEFAKATQSFARLDTVEAHFNQGNAWLMQGKYEVAIASYDRALAKRPDWKDAVENRALAAARAERVKQTGGDMGDQKIGADQIVFDENAKNEKGQETEIAGSKALSDQEIQALWLRRVQTRPSDFLKAKFSYQQAMREEE